MMSQEKKELLLDRYISGQLEGEELMVFEQMLEEDEDLKVDLKLHQEVSKAVLEEDIMDFRQAIQETLEEKNSKGSGFSVYKIAAALVPIIVATWLFFNYGSQKPNTEIVQDYLFPYENLLTVRSDSKDSLPKEQVNLNEAMGFYDKGKHSEALVYFNKLDLNDQVLVSLYKGISHLYNGENQVAIDVLELPVNNNEGIYKHPALYYQALAYIQLDKVEEAIDILTDLEKNASGPYNELAKKVLKEL